MQRVTALVIANVLDYKHTNRCPRGVVKHCAPHAASIALNARYIDVARALKPKPDADYPVERLDRYLSRHDFIYVGLPMAVPLADFKLPRGRYVLLLDIWRENAWQGHYAAATHRALFDWTDSRDGVLRGVFMGV